MTPDTIIEIALDRVGLTISHTTFKDRARNYLNISADDLFSRTRWQWRLKASTITCVASTRNYSLAADVLEPLSFRDTTNDRTIAIVDQAFIDELDANANETGDVLYAALKGINATTGYWTVDLYPTPDAADTISYRYYSQWTTLTSADDAVDLLPKMPQWAQATLVFGISGLYYEEKGDFEASMREMEHMETAIGRAMERNALSQGNRRDRLQRTDGSHMAFDFQVQEGSLH